MQGHPILDEPLFVLATILIVGIVGGEAIARLRLPKVTGWIGAGVLLRELDLPGLGTHTVVEFSPFADFVLGFIAFTIGTSLRFQNLRNAEKRLALLLLGEALVTPAVVLLSLVSLGGVSVGVAMLLATIAIAGSPGTTLIVIRESRAKGLLSRTLKAAAGLIDMVAIATFTFCAAWLAQGSADCGQALRAVGVEFGLAAAIGCGCALLALALTRRLISPAFVGPAMVAVILGAWGLSQACGVSSILACTFAGMTVSNLQLGTARTAEKYLRPFGGVLFAGFYTLVGMHLSLRSIPPVAGIVCVYFVARALGKSLSACISMTLADVTESLRSYLGPALLPQGGVAVGLILFVGSQPQLAEYAEPVAVVGLAALALNEMIGPTATRFMLERAGEIGRDRPHMLDFLGEQHIVHGLVGDKRQLIEALADRLYATTPMPVPKARFVAMALEREREASTCLGRGLAMPHVLLDEADELCGVLGLSSEGLELDAYDGHKVHAVMLLAVPRQQRQRYLELLATVARALAKNTNLREQLYRARSAGHACEILHVDLAAQLNYFSELEQG